MLWAFLVVVSKAAVSGWGLHARPHVCKHFSHLPSGASPQPVPRLFYLTLAAFLCVFNGCIVKIHALQFSHALAHVLHLKNRLIFIYLRVDIAHLTTGTLGGHKRASVTLALELGGCEHLTWMLGAQLGPLKEQQML